MEWTFSIGTVTEALLPTHTTNRPIHQSSIPAILVPVLHSDSEKWNWNAKLAKAQKTIQHQQNKNFFFV